MKNNYTLLVIVFLFVTACSKKLDDVKPFNDNPYDKDYTGNKVVRIDSISTNISADSSLYINRIYYTKLFDNNDGARLYRNGIKINTHYNSVAHTPYLSDIYTISGITYTYEVKLFLGSGEASSVPIIYVTP